jgi:hypothetical protein
LPSDESKKAQQQHFWRISIFSCMGFCFFLSENLFEPAREFVGGDRQRARFGAFAVHAAAG